MRLPTTKNTAHQDQATSTSGLPASALTLFPHAPTPPSQSVELTTNNTSSSEDLYGPERLFGASLDPLGQQRNTAGPSGIASANMAERLPGFDFGRVDDGTDPALPNFGQQLKDPIARDATNVTPGVDDTPYVLYALDALTGNLPSALGAGNGNQSSTISSRPPRPLADETPPRNVPGSPESRTSTSSSVSTLVHSPSRPLPSSLPPHPPKKTQVYVDYDHFLSDFPSDFPRDNFKPAILRPVSLAALIFLCLLMVAGLMFCTIYSSTHHGLTDFDGNIYGGQFFVFRVLPSLLSVVLFLYTNSVALAVIRIYPFSRMAGAVQSSSSNCDGAVFDNLYPQSFFWPQILGPGMWSIRLPLLVFWLMNIVVPLQSTLFSAVLINDKIRWATVRAVACTLIGLYACVTAATILLLFYWYRRQTGLIWDPRSIADYIALATDNSALADYHGTEVLATRDELQTMLCEQDSCRLGYWSYDPKQKDAVRHGLEPEQEDSVTHQERACTKGYGGGLKSKTPNKEKNTRNTLGRYDRAAIDVEALSPHSEAVRYRYLPLWMRSNNLAFVVFMALLLLVALFIVSFFPAAGIREGFPSKVSTTPKAGAFSGADFLYSFLPAILGQLLSMLFADLELPFRILQPWAELAKHAGGAQPEASILADYAACLPLQSTFHAVRNRHWRVAVLSLMATVFTFLPALAGGLFFAQEPTADDATTRIVPNMGLYDFVLALLILYFFCLVAMLPGRKYFRFPHAVTSIAEIMSFCANDDLARESTFKKAFHKVTLRTQLGVEGKSIRSSRWIFATGASGDERRLGIHRVRRYSELTNRPSSRRHD